jgi:hypothetical protein
VDTRLGGTIDIDFDVETKIEAKTLSDSLVRMLRDELGMIAEQDSQKATEETFAVVEVRATAPLRDSKILKGGWRESLDFDLSVIKNNNKIAVHGIARPMVARQATGNLIEYRGPDDSQRATYAVALNKYIHDAIIRACAQSSEVDDKTITCQ